MFSDIHTNLVLTALETGAESIQRFISDPAVSVLVLDRSLIRSKIVNILYFLILIRRKFLGYYTLFYSYNLFDYLDDNDTDEMSTVYTLRLEVGYRTEKTLSIVFIKKGAIIEADKPIGDQIRFTM